MIFFKLYRSSGMRAQAKGAFAAAFLTFALAAALLPFTAGAAETDGESRIYMASEIKEYDLAGTWYLCATNGKISVPTDKSFIGLVFGKFGKLLNQIRLQDSDAVMEKKWKLEKKGISALIKIENPEEGEDGLFIIVMYSADAMVLKDEGKGDYLVFIKNALKMKRTELLSKVNEVKKTAAELIDLKESLQRNLLSVYQSQLSYKKKRKNKCAQDVAALGWKKPQFKTAVDNYEYYTDASCAVWASSGTLQIGNLPRNVVLKDGKLSEGVKPTDAAVEKIEQPKEKAQAEEPPELPIGDYMIPMLATLKSMKQIFPLFKVETQPDGLVEMTGSTAVSTVVMRFKNEELVYFQLNYVGDKAAEAPLAKIKKKFGEGRTEKQNSQLITKWNFGRYVITSSAWENLESGEKGIKIFIEAK